MTVPLISTVNAAAMQPERMLEYFKMGIYAISDRECELGGDAIRRRRPQLSRARKTQCRRARSASDLSAAGCRAQSLPDDHR